MTLEEVRAAADLLSAKYDQKREALHREYVSSLYEIQSRCTHLFARPRFHLYEECAACGLIKDN
jgi:hypothetical protein